MAAVAARGAGRRLSTTEEAAIAADLAAGMTHRVVAGRHGVGRATVSRVAARQDAASAAPPEPDAGEQGPGGTAVTPGADGTGEARTEPPLIDLGAAAVADLGAALSIDVDAALSAAADAVLHAEERIGRLQDELAENERQRLDALAARRSTVAIRDARAQIEYDLEWAQAAAGAAQSDLRAAEGLVATRDDRVRADAERARVQQAVEDGERLAPVARDALRAALLGELAPAGLLRTAQDLAAAEQAAGRGWDVLPPRLPGEARDPWHRAVSQVWGAAVAGDLQRCQAAIVAAGGWHERGPAAAAADGPKIGGTSVDGIQPDRGGLEAANQMPGHWPGTVFRDADGRVLHPDERPQVPLYPPHRHPSGIPVWPR
jgi:hypothetical protein